MRRTTQAKMVALAVAAAGLLVSLTAGGCSKEPTEGRGAAKPTPTATPTPTMPVVVPTVPAVVPTVPDVTPTVPAVTPVAVKDIVDTAVAAGSFKTLVSAVTAAGLADTLKGPGPFTVFAPTDEAFAKLPADTLASLLLPQNKAKLAAILTYHVVPGKVMAADVTSLKTAKTVNGKDLAISVEGGAVMLNGKAKVVKTDVACSNGVIHVIDAVVLPAEPAPATMPAAETATEKAQALLDQALQQIKDKKYDIADATLKQLEGMKDLPASLTDQIKAARTSLTTAKAAAGEVEVPATPAISVP